MLWLLAHRGHDYIFAFGQTVLAATIFSEEVTPEDIILGCVLPEQSIGLREHLRYTWHDAELAAIGRYQSGEGKWKLLGADAFAQRIPRAGRALAVLASLNGAAVEEGYRYPRDVALGTWHDGNPAVVRATIWGELVNNLSMPQQTFRRLPCDAFVGEHRLRMGGNVFSVITGHCGATDEEAGLFQASNHGWERISAQHHVVDLRMDMLPAQPVQGENDAAPLTEESCLNCHFGVNNNDGDTACMRNGEPHPIITAGRCRFYVSRTVPDGRYRCINCSHCRPVGTDPDQLMCWWHGEQSLPVPVLDIPHHCVNYRARTPESVADNGGCLVCAHSRPSDGNPMDLICVHGNEAPMPAPPAGRCPAFQARIVEAAPSLYPPCRHGLAGADSDGNPFTICNSARSSEADTMVCPYNPEQQHGCDGYTMPDSDDDAMVGTITVSRHWHDGMPPCVYEDVNNHDPDSHTTCECIDVVETICTRPCRFFRNALDRTQTGEAQSMRRDDFRDNPNATCSSCRFWRNDNICASWHSPYSLETRFPADRSHTCLFYQRCPDGRGGFVADSVEQPYRRCVDEIMLENERNHCNHLTAHRLSCERPCRDFVDAENGRRGIQNSRIRVGEENTTNPEARPSRPTGPAHAGTQSNRIEEAVPDEQGQVTLNEAIPTNPDLTCGACRHYDLQGTTSGFCRQSASRYHNQLRSSHDVGCSRHRPPGY